MAITGILGRKIGMTQVFDEKGDVHPITVLQAGPCVITQLKTVANDGYDAAQIGLVEFVKESKVNKAAARALCQERCGTGRCSRSLPSRLPAEAEAKPAVEGEAAEAEEAAQGWRSRSGRHLLRREICRRRSAPARAADLPELFAGTDLVAVPSRTVTCSRCRARSAPPRFRRAYFPGSACLATSVWIASPSAICAFAASILKRIC